MNWWFPIYWRRSVSPPFFSLLCLGMSWGCFREPSATQRLQSVVLLTCWDVCLSDVKNSRGSLCSSYGSLKHVACLSGLSRRQNIDYMFCLLENVFNVLVFVTFLPQRWREGVKGWSSTNWFRFFNIPSRTGRVFFSFFPPCSFSHLGFGNLSFPSIFVSTQKAAVDDHSRRLIHWKLQGQGT